jgi:hypothetical protein
MNKIKHLDLPAPSQILLERNIILEYTGDMNNATAIYEHAIGRSVSCYELSTLARYVKQVLKDDKKAEAILHRAIDDIKSFDDGMFMQSIAKYFIPENLPAYAEKMYKHAESVEELLYSVDFFRRFDKARCQPILVDIENQATTIDDYLQLSGMLDLFDIIWAKKVFGKAEALAQTTSNYLSLISEASFFYGWPNFLDREMVNQIIVKATSAAKTAVDRKNIKVFFTYSKQWQAWRQA